MGFKSQLYITATVRINRLKGEKFDHDVTRLVFKMTNSGCIITKVYPKANLKIYVTRKS